MSPAPEATGNTLSASNDETHTCIHICHRNIFQNSLSGQPASINTQRMHTSGNSGVLRLIKISMYKLSVGEQLQKICSTYVKHQQNID